MRLCWLVVLLVIRCFGYELTGRIDPPAETVVFLHGATAPFEASIESDLSGRFRFRKLPAGTYTIAISTAARGQLQQTIELSPGTVDGKGRLDVLLHIDDERLESEGARGTSATVSATVLSIPDRAMKEYEESQRCLARRDSECATTHLLRAVGMAPRFVIAWNQLGVIAYQTRRYAEAEAHFRRALDADPAAFEPLVNLGGVLLNLGRPGEALDYNQQAAARRPNDALANSQLGLSYLELNDPDRAEKYLREAVRLDPAHFSHPQLALAQIYMKRGDRSAALAALRSFLEQHPDAPQAATVHRQIAGLMR